MSVTSAAQSIVQALLAALGPTQNQRLLRLHTPLGPNVLTPVPMVHVTARQEDRQWVILVQDNGPGVPAEFKERLFGPFQRLHGREHAGNGLGLGFCRRAIERLGGRMSMESTPGPGSCFSFTLPAA